MFVCFTYRITGLHFTYGCATLSKAYDGYLYFKNHWVVLYLCVSNLKCSPCWLANPSEPLTYTTRMAAQPFLKLVFISPTYTTIIAVQPQEQPIIVRSTYRITGSH